MIFPTFGPYALQLLEASKHTNLLYLVLEVKQVPECSNQRSLEDSNCNQRNYWTNCIKIIYTVDLVSFAENLALNFLILLSNNLLHWRYYGPGFKLYEYFYFSFHRFSMAYPIWTFMTTYHLILSEASILAIKTRVFHHSVS